jgi:hypothetical protein
MRCPHCHQSFDAPFALLHDQHYEYHCPCGQDLQWDYPIIQLRPSAFMIGAPQPCQHPQWIKPEALFPIM